MPSIQPDASGAGKDFLRDRRFFRDLGPIRHAVAELIRPEPSPLRDRRKLAARLESFALALDSPRRPGRPFTFPDAPAAAASILAAAGGTLPLGALVLAIQDRLGCRHKTARRAVRSLEADGRAVLIGRNVRLVSPSSTAPREEGGAK